MSALQHGIAVVGTDGPRTDGLLRHSRDALLLIPVERPDLFAKAARRLAADQTAESRLRQVVGRSTSNDSTGL